MIIYKSFSYKLKIFRHGEGAFELQSCSTKVTCIGGAINARDRLRPNSLLIVNHNKCLHMNHDLGSFFSFFELNLNRRSEPFLELIKVSFDSKFSIKNILVRRFFTVIKVEMIDFPYIYCNMQFFLETDIG